MTSHRDRLLDHAARKAADAHWKPVLPPEPPVVAGGQGRSDEDVEGAAWGFLGLLASLLISALVWATVAVWVFS